MYFFSKQIHFYPLSLMQQHIRNHTERPSQGIFSPPADEREGRSFGALRVKHSIFRTFFASGSTEVETGLSLSYDSVKAHGDEIRVNSIENHGTEFTIILKTN
jgi:K+-sensing histidine kinase KdpD